MTDLDPTRHRLQDPTRERILDAAGPIFAEKGYQAASVRDITDGAGVNVSAVNYYFRSKEQLYIETVQTAYEAVAGTAALSPTEPGVPAKERLGRFVRAFLTRLLQQNGAPWHRALIMREVTEPTVACAHLVEGFIRPTVEVLKGILHELLPPGVPPRKHQLIACSIAGQCLHYVHGRHIIPYLVGDEGTRDLTVDLLAEHITEFSLAAIGKLYPARKQGARK
jgi:AcrR family transcriptional regulator